jgi:hypothetical protein
MRSDAAIGYKIRLFLLPFPCFFFFASKPNADYDSY